VDLIEVEVIGAETAQAVFDFAHDPHPRVPPLVLTRSHLHVHLRRKHDVIATTLQRAPHDLLGLTGRVHVGRVDEVDAAVEGGVHDAHALVDVDVAPLAEHHGAETVGAHLTPVLPRVRYSMHPPV